jgi:thioredoxin-related protein
MSSIEWQTALGYAEDSAIATRKPILLDFFNPECLGCQQMEAVTYSSEAVISFVKDNLIPLRIDWDKKESYERYHAIWSPTLFVLDHHGNEVQRNVGFLEPGKFMALMLLGIAKVYMTTGEHDAANVNIKRLIEHYPESSAVPEAIYFKGVNLSKQKEDLGQMRLAYEELLSKYPASSWAKRAAPYRLVT